jgi:hypothetical protein
MGCAEYGRRYEFDGIGNMTRKESESRWDGGKAVGAALDYEYYEGYAHRAERIGTRYYRYDENGNVTAEGGTQDTRGGTSGTNW